MLSWLVDRLPGRKFGLLLSLPSVIFLFGVILYPLVNLILTSLQSYDDFFNVSFVGLDNFRFIFDDSLFWWDLVRSFIYTAGSVFIFFPVGFAVALSLHKINKYETFLRGVSLMPWAIPPVTASMMWRWSLNRQYGIINDWLQRLHLVDEPVNWLTGEVTAMLVIILVDAWIRIPFAALLLLAGLKSISAELYESASIDGAGYAHVFGTALNLLEQRRIDVRPLLSETFTFDQATAAFEKAAERGQSIKLQVAVFA